MESCEAKKQSNQEEKTHNRIKTAEDPKAPRPVPEITIIESGGEGLQNAKRSR
jgi:hypothetical protein